MAYLVDDLGNPIRLASLRELRRRAGRDGFLSKESLGRVRQVVRVRGGEFSAVGWAAINAVAALGWLAGLKLILSMVSGDRLLFALGLGAWTVFVVLLTRWIPRHFVASDADWAVSRAMVAEGVCGSCGYVIGGLHPDARGVVVCPECRAEWRASRIGQPDREVAAPKHTGIHAPPRRLRSAPLSTDDRNRLVPIVDRRLRVLTAERRAALGKAIEPLAAELAFVGAGVRLFASGVISLPLLLATFLILYSPIDELSLRAATFLTLGAAGTAVIVWWIMISNLGVNARAIIFHVLCRGRCPSCLEECRDVPPAADGRVECPRCGSAWRPASRVSPNSPPPASMHSTRSGGS